MDFATLLRILLNNGDITSYERGMVNAAWGALGQKAAEQELLKYISPNNSNYQKWVGDGRIF